MLTVNTPRAFHWGAQVQVEYPCSTKTKFFEGAAIGLVAGVARPLIAGDTFGGFALSPTLSKANGSLVVNAQFAGSLELAVTGVTSSAQIGESVYASDDNTFTTTVGSNTYIGKVVQYDTSSSLALISFDVVSGTVGVGAIANDSVTYAKLQNVSATSRFLGRITSGAGDAEELTGTQANTLLDAFTSGAKGLVSASGGGTTNFARADGTWAAPPGSAAATYDNTQLGLEKRLVATTIQTAVDEIIAKRIAGAVLLSSRFTLVGDATTDNNTAILAWIAAGVAMLATYASVVMELVPESTGNIFATTGRHVFPAGLILVFKGGSLLKATGTDQTAPLITHSEVAYDLAVDNGVTHIYTNRNHIGIRTLNVNGRYMTVRDIRGFTIGHQLAATTFTSPIIVDYGKIGICTYPVECCTLSENSAFVSDNVLRGGEIISTSALNNYGSAMALTIVTEYDAGNFGNNGNYWYKPQVQSQGANLSWSAGASLTAGRRYLGALTGSEWFCKTSGTSGSTEPTIIPAGSNRVDVSNITTVAGNAQITMASTTGISAGWQMRGTNPLSNFPFDTYVTSVDSGTQLTMSNTAMTASSNYRAHFIAPTTDNTATLIYVGPYRRGLVWNRDCGSDNGIYNTRRETGIGEAVINSGAYMWPLTATGVQTYETTVTVNANTTTTAKICFFPLWAAGTTYAKGDMVRKLLVGATFWECIVGGASHATTEPTIADVPGTTGTDNAVTWIARAMPTTTDRGDIGVYNGSYFNPRSVISSVMAASRSLPTATVDNLHLRAIMSATGWLVQGMQKCTTGGVLSQSFATTDLSLSREGLSLLTTSTQLGFLIRTAKQKYFQINRHFGTYTRSRARATAFGPDYVKLEGLSGQNAYNPRLCISDMSLANGLWSSPADTSIGADHMLVGTDTPYVFYGVTKGSTGTPVACTLSGISVTALNFSAALVTSAPQVQLFTQNGLTYGLRASLGTPTVGFFLSLGEYIRNASATTSASTKGYFVTTAGILAPNWATSTTYVKGDLVNAGGNVYAANGSFTSGTTPSGTAANFLDSTATSIVSGDVATWDYMAPVAVLTADDQVIPLATGVSGFLLVDNGGTQVVRLSADITGVHDDTYKDIAGLGFSLLANATYEFEYTIIADADAVTTGIDVSINGPASPTAFACYTNCVTSSTSSFIRLNTTYDTNHASTASAGATARPYAIKGVIVNGANAGTLIARIKREAVGSGPSVRAGSYGVLRRIA